MYFDYKDWEDFKAGMFSKEVRVDFIDKSTLLMSNIKPAMLRVINEWPIACKHNLSNVGSNRKSWLGQAACCINHGASEFETRMCWRTLSKEIQAIANDAANEVIAIWEQQNNFIKEKYVKEDFTL